MNDAENPHYAPAEVGSQWATPKRIWKPLADALDGFDLDAAAGCEPEPLADTRYTEREDGLETPWFGDVWVNWPYGRWRNPDWAARIGEQADRDAVDTVTALAPSATAAKWFQTHLRGATYYTLVGEPGANGRVTFLDRDPDTDEHQNNATFGSLILSFGAFPDAYEAALDDLGYRLEPSGGADP